MLFAHLKTIFSFRFYHRLAFASARQMAAFGIYLFMLSLIVFYFFSNGYIEKNLPVLLKNFPQVTFEKGVLTAPKTPVSVTVPQSDFNLVFDASLTTPPTAEQMLKNKTFLLISGNQAYMLSSGGIQQTALPPTLNFVTSQENLNKEKDTLSEALSAVCFLTSLLLIPLLMLFGFLLAGTVGLFFKLFYQSRLPRAVVLKWAFFLLGPLCALWYARLWWNIPLFTLAQVILCIIYMQQIFNTLPEER